MRRFSAVFALGVLAFVALAVPSARRASPRAGDAAAGEGVREFLVIERHFQASGGDPRFAERMPASPRLVREALEETAFARDALGIVEQPELVRMEPLGADTRPDGVVEVRTREYWIFRRRPVAAGRAPLEPVSAVVRAVYEVGREGGRWIVLDYRVEPGRAGEG